MCARRNANGPTIWGATPAEVAAPYPCDLLNFPHDAVYYRAITIEAPPGLVYRWLLQLRVAPYSYDWLDNFGLRSPPQLTPGLEHVAIGQRLMRIFRVASFEPGATLTTVLDSRTGARLMGNFAGSYCVDAQSMTTSRLRVKILVHYPAGTYGKLLRLAMPYIDRFMFVKQLRTLRVYAERDARFERLSAAAAR